MPYGTRADFRQSEWPDEAGMKEAKWDPMIRAAIDHPGATFEAEINNKVRTTYVKQRAFKRFGAHVDVTRRGNIMFIRLSKVHHEQ